MGEFIESGWCCVDCLMMLANGDMPQDMDADVLVVWESNYRATCEQYLVTLGMLRELHLCPEGTEECDCEVIEFSSSQCDVCMSWLAGSRHAVSFFEH